GGRDDATRDAARRHRSGGASRRPALASARRQTRSASPARAGDPIVADPFVDREFGSGVVKITPAHDPHDFDCARRLGLPAINIPQPDATLNENAGPYAGLSVSDARKRVVADLEAAGLLVGVKDHPHEVPHCDRCDTLVQPLLSEQWFMRMEPLAR